MKEKKVLHISANQYLDLSHNHHTKNIWIELAKGATEYHIIARSKNNQFSTSKEGDIYLHLIPKITERQWSFFFTSWIMIYYIYKYNINILLAQCPIMGGFQAAIMSKLFKIPLMVEIHGNEYFDYAKKKKSLFLLLNWIQIFTFRRAKIIRSLSPKMSIKIKQICSNLEPTIIPNRVNIELFSLPKNNHNIANNITLVSVGRFVEAKNYITLIEVAKILNAELYLIGGGPYKEKYIDIILSEFKSKIHLIDWVNQSELIHLITKADIYIQSSISEGMPRTILEAMALKMPIITTNVGSIEGIIIHKYNGLLITNPYNINEYISCINELTHNNELRTSIANNAYFDALNKYEWNKMFNLYRETIYNML